MKIFLTGQPHAGKSTLLHKVIENVQAKNGFLSPAVMADGQRIGFDIVSARGTIVPLARINSSSRTRVSRYGVHVLAIDDLRSELLSIQPSDLLYIDEIGQMEFLCPSFEKVLHQYLQSNNSFIGTLSAVYSNPVIDSIRSNPQYTVIEITPENRDQVAKDIIKMLG